MHFDIFRYFQHERKEALYNNYSAQALKYIFLLNPF